MIRAGEVPLPENALGSVAKAEDLKLEIPLLPDDKLVDLARETQQIIKPEDLEQAEELIRSEDESAMVDKEFSEFLQSKSDKMTRSAEQEKLSSIDSTARVPVPIMDFSVPKPEWSEGGCDTAARVFSWIKAHNGHINWNPMRWPSNRAAEQRMIWSPIAHIWDTKQLVCEQIEVDDNLLGRFRVMTLDRDVMSSTDCLVKRNGLLILRDYDLEDELLDEDEVFERKFGPREHMSSRHPIPILAEQMAQRFRKQAETAAGRKRGRHDVEEDDGWTKTDPPKSFQARSKVASSRDSQAADIGMMDSASALQILVDESQWDDHSNLVQNHAKRHSYKKPKVNSRFFGSSQTAGEAEDGALMALRRTREKETDAKAMPPPPKPITALAPSVTLPDTPPKIIVASSVSSMLILELRNYIPGLGIISRDYGRWTPRSRGPRGLVSANLEHTEADISLSPATGVLMATMVKLSQKSLPGTGAAPGNDFRGVVENVATKYERLLVLISEGNKHSESITPLNGSDANALVEFQGFLTGLSSSLGCEISVLYIGGGNETLAQWVAATICKYANEGASVADPLLEDETCWEVFLRRAGMNSFGAQAVLGLLKNTEAEDELAVGAAEDRLYGLPLFVMMSVEERIAMFEDIFGGRKVIERVSEVLDAEWGPRARPGKMMMEDHIGHQRGLEGMMPSQGPRRSWAWERSQNRI